MGEGLAAHRSSHADDKAVESFAKRSVQHVVTRTDELAASLAKPDAEQDIAELARLLGQSQTTAYTRATASESQVSRCTC